ncbi:uncharacterized protein LOC144913820 isoform X1 [Branchiostoma floridae x Branchiostoma belcheri]
MSGFPLKQLLVVAGILFTHHFGSSVIFPFLPFLTHDFFPYLKPNQIGYYAGFLASAYFTGSFFGSFMWGRLSDFLGRRPILLCGIVGSMLSSTFFGFSLSFGWAVGARFMWGFLDGNLGVAKTYLFEAADEAYHAFTFSLVGASSGLGRLVGPIIGGFLSCPAARVRGLDVFILEKFPYLLPCLVAVFLSIINLLASSFFLKETRWGNADAGDKLPTPRDNRVCQGLLEPEEDSGFDGPDGEEEDLENEHWDETIRSQEECPEQSSDSSCCSPCCLRIRQKQTQGSDNNVPIRKLLTDRRIMLSCVLYGLLGFSAILSNELLPLLLVSNHEHGGYNFETSEISLVLTGSAVFQIFSQIFVFPTLSKKYSYKTLFRWAIFIFTIGTVLTPFMNQMTGPIPGPTIQNATDILPPYTVAPSSDGSHQPADSVLRFSVREPEFNIHKSNNDSNIGKCRLDDKGSNNHVAISDVPAKVWSTVVFTTTLAILGRVSGFTAIMVMVGNSAMPYFRGTVNGISQSLVALARLLGPIVGGNLFAWTTDNGLPWPLNFHLAFYLAALINILILCLTLLLPNSINKPRTEDIGEEVEEDFIEETSVLCNQEEQEEQICSDRRIAVIA